MEDDFVPTWIPTGAAYELAKHLVDAKGGIDVPIGKRLIQLAAVGKILAIAGEQTQVVKIPEEDQKEIDAARKELSADAFFEWKLQRNKERLESMQSSRPKLRIVHQSFWLHFLDDVELPYFVGITSESWEDEGFFSYTKTDTPLENPNSMVETFNTAGFDMVTAREVYFLEESIYYVTSPPKIWATLDDLEFDDNNFKISKTSEILSRRIARKNKQINGEDNQKEPPKIGRRGAKHGDAIASMTLKLMQTKPDELKRYTALSLSLELKKEYQSIGETPPSAQNLERYSAGILKVLRT